MEEKDNGKNVIYVRANPDEHRKIQKSAKELGVSMNRFLIDAGLGIKLQAAPVMSIVTPDFNDPHPREGDLIRIKEKLRDSEKKVKSLAASFKKKVIEGRDRDEGILWRFHDMLENIGMEIMMISISYEEELANSRRAKKGVL